MIKINSPILVLGYPGRLASAIVKLHPEVIPLMHKQLDITDKNSISSAIKKYSPKVIINCAALTNVEYCESHPEEARKVNVEGVKNLSGLAKSSNILLVHFSSSYALAPINEYSRTKFASESLVGADGIVIRTDFFDSSFWLLNNLMQNKPVKLLSTRYLNPISINALIKITFQLIEKGFRGIINIGTKNRINFYQLGIKFCDAFNLNSSNIQEIKELDEKVKRNNDQFLSTEKLINLGIEPPAIEEDLQDFKEFIKNENTIAKHASAI